MNKTIRILGYIGIYLLSFLQCYLLSLVYTGAGIALVFAVMSIFTDIVMHNFYLLYLLSSIPLSLIFFVIVVRKK